MHRTDTLDARHHACFTFSPPLAACGGEGRTGRQLCQLDFHPILHQPPKTLAFHCFHTSGPTSPHATQLIHPVSHIRRGVPQEIINTFATHTYTPKSQAMTPVLASTQLTVPVAADQPPPSTLEAQDHSPEGRPPGASVHLVTFKRQASLPLLAPGRQDSAGAGTSGGTWGSARSRSAGHAQDWRTGAASFRLGSALKRLGRAMSRGWSAVTADRCGDTGGP
jgi:hypothetical protein